MPTINPAQYSPYKIAHSEALYWHKDSYFSSTAASCFSSTAASCIAGITRIYTYLSGRNWHFQYNAATLIAANGEALQNPRLSDNRIPDWDDYLALKIEYANFLKRLAALNERVARAAHHVPRLSLREVHNWARLYSSATPAVRRVLTGHKGRKSSVAERSS